MATSTPPFAPAPAATARPRAAALACLAAAAVAVGLTAGSGRALAQQQDNPVYVDDSPTAEQTLGRAGDHLAGRNTDEAVRVLQRLLDEDPDRVVATDTDPDLFLSVRARVHAMLLSSPLLLERYRALQGESALAILREEGPERVERSRLLTSAGFDAAMMLAHRRLVCAQFEAARLTLEQLRDHPDRTGDRARDAWEMMLQLARYIDRESFLRDADAWRPADQTAAAATPIDWPAAARRRGTTPLDSAGPLSVEGLLAKPLWSALMSQGVPARIDETHTARRDDLPTFARDLWILPTVCDDQVLINDGRAITAYDRFTLSTLWSVVPAGAFDAGADSPDDEDPELRMFNARPAGGFGVPVEDPSVVAVSGRTAVAATGVAVNGVRIGDARVHSIDTATGRVRWSVQISDLDPALTQAGVRGPALLQEGVVVVGARKFTPERRVISLYLIGLDAGDGSLLWKNMVASTGSMPWNRQILPADAGTLIDGVVYRADRLGVIAAYEAASGRAVWVRRVETPSISQTDSSVPWAISSPVIDGDSIVLISPDEREILRIERATGRVLARRGSDRFSTPPPQYLLRTSDHLVAVSSNTVSSVPIADFDTAEITQSPFIPDPGIRGRVSVAGDFVLVPTAAGAMLADAQKLEAPARPIELDSPGNVLPLGNQLLVVDDYRVHSYLLWEEAERILGQRMAADARDPAPATTFAELAYRAQKDDQIVPAVDRAMRAIEGSPDRAAAAVARDRLFESIHTMVRATQELDVRQAASSTEAVPTPRISGRNTLAELVDRMERVAGTADQRATSLLARGRLLEDDKKWVEAIRAYQGILTDDALSAATWAGARVSVRADTEASRRVRDAVLKEGPSVYTQFDQACEQESAALGASATAESLERLARRYPMARGAANAWMRAADIYDASSARASADASLRAAFDSALRLPTPDPVSVGEAAGRLVDRYRRRGLYEAAQRVLTRARAAAPNGPLTSRGANLDLGPIESEITSRLVARRHWPSIGSLSDDGAQMIQGWSLMSPVLRERIGLTPPFLVMQSDNEIGLWAPPGRSQSSTDTDLRKIWSGPKDENSTWLVAADDEAAYFFTMTKAGGVLEKIAVDAQATAAANGAVVAASKWRTQPFESLFQPTSPAARQIVRRAPGQAAMDDFVDTPLDGLAMRRDVLVCRDEAVIVLVERSGRAVAFDCGTGALEWTSALPIDVVHDCDLSGGVLAVGGDHEARDRSGAVLSLEPGVAVVDAQSGSLMQTISPRQGRVRWVRIAPDSSLLTGTETAIVSTDISQAATNWIVTDWHVKASRAAWVFGETLFVLAADRTMWTVPVSTGRLAADPIEIPREHLDGIRAVDMSQADPSTLAIRGYQGLVLLSPAGQIKGMDALGGFESLLPPLTTSDGFITIESIENDRRSDGMMTFALHRFDNRSALLLESRTAVLGANPHTIALLDGRVAVSAGTTTVVYQAPIK